jgi:hypothetical protein
MIRTNVIKVLALYNMSAKELKLGMKQGAYTPNIIKDAHFLETVLSAQVWLGERKIYKKVQ